MTSKLSEVGLESVSATFSPPSKHIKGRVSVTTAQSGPYLPTAAAAGAAKTPDSMPTDIYSISTPVDTTHFVSLYSASLAMTLT